MVKRDYVINLMQDARLSRQSFSLLVYGDHRCKLRLCQPDWARLDLKGLTATVERSVSRAVRIAPRRVVFPIVIRLQLAMLARGLPVLFWVILSPLPLILKLLVAIAGAPLPCRRSRCIKVTLVSLPRLSPHRVGIIGPELSLLLPRPDAVTVGGELDVATVTKHEGFKWINRKHYYSRELNPLETDHA